MSIIKIAFAVFTKELKSEFRTRISFSSIILFLITTIAIILYSTKDISKNADFISGLLWILFFFGSMLSMPKAFVSESERNTSIFLKSIAKAETVFLGKLIYNCLLAVITNIFAVFVFLLLISQSEPSSIGELLLSVVLISLGIASVSTVVSSILAKESVKSSIFPILTFPVLLPFMLSSVNAMSISLSRYPGADSSNDMLIMLSYIGVVITMSYLLFDKIWED